MARKLERLTALQVHRLGIGRHPDGLGLYLHVTPEGRYWFFRWGGGGSRYLSLGPAHSITLKLARERTRQLRAQLLAGIDPKAEREAQRLAAKLAAVAGASFAEIAGRYFDSHQAAWSKRTAHEMPQLMALHAMPLLGDLPISAIDTKAVIKTLEPIWYTRTPTASRLRQLLEAILDFAKVRGLRDGDNPARWRGHLEQLLPAPGKLAPATNYAALPFSEIPNYLQQLQQRPGTTARALEFTILTAARIGAVLQATWSEISGAQWTAPAAHMKIHKPHRTPLSTAACAVLEQLPESARRPDQLIFPAPNAARPIHKNRVVELAKTVTGVDITVHGFRATFSTWASEQTSFPPHVIEMALAHAIGDKVIEAYRRGELLEQRQQLMETWGRYCTAAAPATVIPLARRG